MWSDWKQGRTWGVWCRWTGLRERTASSRGADATAQGTSREPSPGKGALLGQTAGRGSGSTPARLPACLPALSTSTPACSEESRQEEAAAGTKAPRLPLNG